MNRTGLGILAGIAGAAFATWWMRRQRVNFGTTSSSERGEVIFSNSPQA